MKIFILLSVVAVAFAGEKCGENEHYESCGTACPLSCDNYDNPPLVCILRCDSGCFCDKGYVRGSDGRCVRPEECPAKAQQCGANEHFESCGTACPLTCENYQNPPRFCVLRCDIGCHCDAGFVRRSDGQCVRTEECPAQAETECGENKKYSDCGTACPLTCDNYDNPPKICPAMCVMGCHCKSGYVQTRDGRCVRPEKCPSNAKPLVQTCHEKADSGMCLAYIPSWYYDAETGKCSKFIYGGCQGNGNRYSSEEECLKNCNGVTVEQSSSGACVLPAETGVCRGFFPRFYYDIQTGKCEKFIYGGCGGNENNFESIEECRNTCAQSAPSACQEEKVVGPCKAMFIRYYYNKETGKCEKFVYGGCNGNSNNFNSQEECEAVCSG